MSRYEGLRSLASLFTVDGKPGSELITQGQLEIWESIIIRDNKRVQVITSTQYGKSLWIALACIIITAIEGEMVAVIAPSSEKAKIIMRYYIEHLGDHIVFSSKLEKNSRLEKLRQEENKERIILNNGGGIFVVSAQQKNATKSVEAAMGMGAKNVIMDEACLISDNTESTIFRMIAGKGKDAFYCKIGNPFYAQPPYSHFKQTWDGNKYKKIFIDYKQAIAEGRYNEEFIEEARSKPLFDVLFECKFPPLDVIDEKGYRPLIAEESWLQYGVTKEMLVSEILKQEYLGTQEIPDKKMSVLTFDNVFLGGDIGGGGDHNEFVVRCGRYAYMAQRTQAKDTMTNIPVVEDVVTEFGVMWDNVFIDDIGIGRGVSDRLIEKEYNICPVSVGERANDKETYMNLKAELWWSAREWLKKEDTVLCENGKWYQLLWLRYKVNSERKVQAEPKQDMKKRTNKSPDTADALVLTFYERPFIGIV